MSIKSTAGQLARLKVTYPLWQFERHDADGAQQLVTVFVAIKGRRRLTGTTPAELENELIRAAYE